MATMIAGQVPAADTPFADVEGMPTEKELAQSVLSLPSTVHGKLLGGVNNQIAPAQMPDHVVKCSVEHRSRLLPSRQETYSVVDNWTHEPFAGGVYIQETKALAGLFGGRFVMYDSNNRPLCLARRDHSKPIQRVYLIMGTEPLFAQDMPLDQEDGKDFYPWFMVRDVDDSHLEFRSLLVWNGNNYQPMMRVKPCPRQRANPGVQAQLPPRKTDQLVVDATDETKTYGLFHKAKNKENHTVEWHICAAPGTDVTAMIMLSALMEDMVGWFA